MPSPEPGWMVARVCPGLMRLRPVGPSSKLSMSTPSKGTAALGTVLLKRLSGGLEGMDWSLLVVPSWPVNRMKSAQVASSGGLPS